MNKQVFENEHLRNQKNYNLLIIKKLTLMAALLKWFDYYLPCFKARFKIKRSFNYG